MLRILVIRDKDKDTDLRDRLLSAALTSEQADSALEALQALNPHTDIRKPSAGTVLLVPDTPAFKASASVPVLGETFDSFQQLVKSALSNAAENLKAANAARAAERDEVMAVIKRPAGHAHPRRCRAEPTGRGCNERLQGRTDTGRAGRGGCGRRQQGSARQAGGAEQAFGLIRQRGRASSLTDVNRRPT